MIDRLHLNYKNHKAKKMKKLFKQNKMPMMEIATFDQFTGEALTPRVYRVRPDQLKIKQQRLTQELEDLNELIADLDALENE